jgi:hypothetical protein
LFTSFADVRYWDTLVCEEVWSPEENGRSADGEKDHLNDLLPSASDIKFAEKLEPVMDPDL